MKKLLPLLMACLASLLLACCNEENCKSNTPADMFCITALEPGLEVSMKLFDEDFKHTTPSLLYSLDGRDWKDFFVGQTVVTLPASGDKLYVKANGRNTAFGTQADSTVSFIANMSSFKFSKQTKVSGNVMYLLDGEHPDEVEMEEFALYCLFLRDSLLMDASELLLPAGRLNAACYMGMFSGTSISQAPALPATELARSCYEGMFRDCPNLTAAPELPATQMAESCYQSMFSECPHLKKAPQLPAANLALSCYSLMFHECTSLTAAPKLPAMELEDYCYVRMFEGCTSLTEAPELPATEVKEYCYAGMFKDCTSLKFGPALLAERLAPYCYSRMFRGCTSLTYLTCLATDMSAEHCVDRWLMDVDTAGTLHIAHGTDWTGLIPATWTVEYYDDTLVFEA